MPNPRPRKLSTLSSLVQTIFFVPRSHSDLRLGHVDAGKSTLMGRLLYDCGAVDERVMRKFRQESEQIGKGSFALAWVLDQTEEERAR